MSRAYFNETQRFRQVWILIIIILSIAGWGYAVISGVVANDATEKQPASDLVLILTGIIPLLLIFLVFKLKLVTRVRNDGLYFQFKPLQLKEKHISPDDIVSFEVRKYKPIAEYGGWGVRAGGKKSGRAYNVSGNMGLQLVLKNGKKILIGTKQPEEIKKAMEAMMRIGNQIADTRNQKSELSQ
jgi:hypothetical protein